MKNQDPEWLQKQKTHNALTTLNLARSVSPLVMFGMVYFALEFLGGFSNRAMIGISILAGLGDYLVLSWLVSIIKGKDNTIG